jgi:hypothetical protein
MNEPYLTTTICVLLFAGVVALGAGFGCAREHDPDNRATRRKGLAALVLIPVGVFLIFAAVGLVDSHPLPTPSSPPSTTSTGTLAP